MNCSGLHRIQCNLHLPEFVPGVGQVPEKSLIYSFFIGNPYMGEQKIHSQLILEIIMEFSQTP